MKYKFTFNLLIAMDHLANVLLLGRIGVCLSTRAYVQAQLLNQRKWRKWERCINWVMREKGHCLKSFAWELNRKSNWINEHKKLLKK